MTTFLKTKDGKTRQDTLAVFGGVVFSFVFTGVIWLLGGRLDSIELLPDTGASWYYWKLPNPTFWTQATAWGLYLLHQVFLWGLIYYSQMKKTRYTAGLHKVNLIALGGNALFILLHLLQTHVWYDGLAQNVSIWSSQVSVIIMLVAILVMENQRRGMFFGKKFPLPKDSVSFWRKYHGYIFSWAIIYTFWYHPMVSTTGHLIGFLYMFLLMLQGSLFFTRIHVNKWWTFAQEGTVLIHGTLVAIGQGGGLWPMFAFGFAGILVITQMYGLGLSKWARWGIAAFFIVAMLFVYSDRGWVQLNEVIRIPLIEYLSAIVLAFLTSGIIRLVKLFEGKPRLNETA